jgi:Domain of unknown function (DUF4349)
MYRKVFLTMVVLVVLSLAGCASKATPQLVASYPSDAQSQHASPPGVPPSPAQFVYDAYIELEVSNVGSASSRAQELASICGGYLESSQSWHSDGKENLTLLLAVPVANYQSLHDALTRLGSLSADTVTGQWVSTGYGSEWTVYSEITLQMHSKGISLPSLPSLPGWHPLHTLQNAFSVFTTVFGFLLDIIIWISVVLGPFVLLGYIARRLVRKFGHR